MAGHVYLVGAGPGDPGLITVKGLELIRTADVVIFDALGTEELLKECPNAELVNVGKRSCKHTKTQDEINQILVDYGKKDLKVVRLKGGDPFLFGRGAEEIAALRKEGIEVTVVPGISSSIAVPELAGIPVTRRGRVSAVTILTGHEMDDKDAPLDWSKLASGESTLVILMGISNAGKISRTLIESGMSPDMPAGVITNGSKPEQRAELMTLGTLEQTIKEKELKAPGIIVIGEVVLEREILGDLV